MLSQRQAVPSMNRTCRFFGSRKPVQKWWHSNAQHTPWGRCNRCCVLPVFRRAWKRATSAEPDNGEDVPVKAHNASSLGSRFHQHSCTVVLTTLASGLPSSSRQDKTGIICLQTLLKHVNEKALGMTCQQRLPFPSLRSSSARLS